LPPGRTDRLWLAPPNKPQKQTTYNKHKIEEISTVLTKEKFQLKPYERIWIPKPNGKWKPLGIPSPLLHLFILSLLFFLEQLLPWPLADCVFVLLELIFNLCLLPVKGYRVFNFILNIQIKTKVPLLPLCSYFDCSLVTA